MGLKTIRSMSNCFWNILKFNIHNVHKVLLVTIECKADSRNVTFRNVFLIYDQAWKVKIASQKAKQEWQESDFFQKYYFPGHNQNQQVYY